MKMMSSFIHPYVTAKLHDFLLWNPKDDILKNVVFLSNDSQQGPMLFWTSFHWIDKVTVWAFFKTFSLDEYEILIRKTD